MAKGTDMLDWAQLNDESQIGVRADMGKIRYVVRKMKGNDKYDVMFSAPGCMMKRLDVADDEEAGREIAEKNYRSTRKTREGIQ